MAEKLPAHKRRVKLWIDSAVLDRAQAKAEAESSEVRRVYVADIVRDAIFTEAAKDRGGQETAEHIHLREGAQDRRRWPLTVDAIPFDAAKERLRARGLSVAAVAEQGLIDYVQGRKRR